MSLASSHEARILPTLALTAPKMLEMPVPCPRSASRGVASVSKKFFVGSRRGRAESMDTVDECATTPERAGYKCRFEGFVCKLCGIGRKSLF